MRYGDPYPMIRTSPGDRRWHPSCKFLEASARLGDATMTLLSVAAAGMRL
jgi:hypothetical protein